MFFLPPCCIIFAPNLNLPLAVTKNLGPNLTTDSQKHKITLIPSYYMRSISDGISTNRWCSINLDSKNYRSLPWSNTRNTNPPRFLMNCFLCPNFGWSLPAKMNSPSILDEQSGAEIERRMIITGRRRRAIGIKRTVDWADGFRKRRVPIRRFVERFHRRAPNNEGFEILASGRIASRRKNDQPGQRNSKSICNLRNQLHLGILTSIERNGRICASEILFSGKRKLEQWHQTSGVRITR